jgi:Ran GTPase-activating protein (RanGAP) involved in mRNA processing and transport
MLSELYLSLNFLDNQGAIRIARILSRKSCPLTRLDLSHIYAGLPGIKAIARSITHNTRLTDLNLSCNFIQKEGAIEIAKSLLKNSTLTMLNLSCGAISYQGVKVLGEVLCFNTGLLGLNLKSNSIQKDGAKALGEMLCYNSTLTSLNLQKNELRNKSLTELAHALGHFNQTLTILNIQLNPSSDHKLKVIRQLISDNENRQLRKQLIYLLLLGTRSSQSTLYKFFFRNTLCEYYLLFEICNYIYPVWNRKERISLLK